MLKNKRVNTYSPRTKKPKQKAHDNGMLCAASVLPNSTDVLARRHRKSQVPVLTDTQLNKKAPMSHGNGKKTLNLNHTKGTHGDPSSCEVVPLKRKALENSNYASPCLKSMPSGVVKKMVKNIETKPICKRVAFDVANTKRNRNKLPATILASNSDSIIAQQSFYAGISTDVKPNIAPEDFSVIVAVRVRPFNQKEKENGNKQVIFMHGNEATVVDGSNNHTFAYDYSFDSTGEAGSLPVSQVMVYEKLARPLLGAAFSGYNACLFAYGQTGSGKSYTVMGSGEDVGIIPRFCDEMFGGVRTITAIEKSVRFHIEMSYFEIYNEKIHDLLVSSSLDHEGATKKSSLKVREHPETGPYVEGLSKFIVRNFDDVRSWLDVGNQQRVTASTGMNDCSSRSHAVFLLNMTKTTVEELEGEHHESSSCSRINLVDLAGSERSSTAQTTGQRLKEGAHINKSLLTLGKVITMLSQRAKAATRGRNRIFIPYRDSALTWLLKESLGGNSRTAMIATVSPANSNTEETLSTLRYAAQARTIVNSVKINEDPNAAIIRELKAEISKLREARESETVNVQEFQNTMKEVAMLKEKLVRADKDKTEVGETWKRKLEETENRKAEEIAELKRAGVSFKVDNKLPNLVNLNEDPQLSELLLYVIRHGVTRIGRRGGPVDCEIQLSSALICDIHCKITNKNEIVTISPSHPDAKLFINGELVSSTTVLHHADRIVIGGDHFFRLNHPIEVQRKKKEPGCTEGQKDFAFAKKELITAQNARMEKEIEEARLHERQKMLKEIEVAKKEAEIELTNQKQQYENVVESLKHRIDEDQKTREEMEVIKEKNLTLQKQVETKRKICGMKEEIQAQKYLEEKNSIFKNVFAELEAESKRIASEIGRLENNLQKRRESEGWESKPADCGKWTPLRVSILLEEANRISKMMEKDTVFSRFEPISGPPQIRVENTRLRICTLWPMEKFEGKLDGMREAYLKNSSKNGHDLSGDSCDNLFYDPADDWSEMVADANVDQKTYLKHTRDTPTSSRSKGPKRKSRRISSIVLTQSSPALQQSLLQYEHSRNRSPSKRESLKSLCRTVLAADSFTSSELSSSPIDLLLSELDQFAVCCENAAEKFYEQARSQSEQQYDKTMDELALQATLHLHGCFMQIDNLRSTAVRHSHPKSSRLTNNISKTVEKMKGELAKLLQGVDEEIEQIIDDSSGKIRLHTANIAKYTGALCLVLNCKVTCFNEEAQQNLSYRVKNAFTQGADSLLRKTISEGISCINEQYHNNEKLSSSQTVTSSITLLECCKELQQDLHNASLLIRENDAAPSYHRLYLARTSSMVESVKELVDIILDSTGDLINYKGCLNGVARRIASLPLPIEVTPSSSDESSFKNQEYSSPPREIEKRYIAIQDAAENLIRITNG